MRSMKRALGGNDGNENLEEEVTIPLDVDPNDFD